MGGTVPEPQWKGELREAFDQNAWKIGGPYGDWDTDEAMKVTLPHIDAAYQRGLQAARSQSGYRTTRKKKDAPCSTSPSAPDAAGSTPASAPGDEP